MKRDNVIFNVSLYLQIPIRKLRLNSLFMSRFDRSHSEKQFTLKSAQNGRRVKSILQGKQVISQRINHYCIFGIVLYLYVLFLLKTYINLKYLFIHYFLLITFIYFNNRIRLYKNYFPNINQNNFQHFKKNFYYFIQ